MSADGKTLTASHSITQPRRVIWDTPNRMKMSDLPKGFEYTRLDRKQTAKLIREDLKTYYPQTKFSVRTESLSGGYAVIKVRWESGDPNTDEMYKFLRRYEGADSDLGDNLYFIVTEIEGRWYHFAVDYITVERTGGNPGVIEGTVVKRVPKLAEGGKGV